MHSINFTATQGKQWSTTRVSQEIRDGYACRWEAIFSAHEDTYAYGATSCLSCHIWCEDATKAHSFHLLSISPQYLQKACLAAKSGISYSSSPSSIITPISPCLVQTKQSGIKPKQNKWLCRVHHEEYISSCFGIGCMGKI